MGIQQWSERKQDADTQIRLLEVGKWRFGLSSQQFDNLGRQEERFLSDLCLALGLNWPGKEKATVDPGSGHSGCQLICFGLRPGSGMGKGEGIGTDDLTTLSHRPDRKRELWQQLAAAL